MWRQISIRYNGDIKSSLKKVHEREIEVFRWGSQTGPWRVCVDQPDLIVLEWTPRPSDPDNFWQWILLYKERP